MGTHLHVRQNLINCNEKRSFFTIVSYYYTVYLTEEPSVSAVTEKFRVVVPIKLVPLAFSVRRVRNQFRDASRSDTGTREAN